MGHPEEPCGACRVFDQEAIEKGWSPQEVAAELAVWRAENLRRVVEERARCAGKSDQQLDAERAAAKASRELIEPPIPTPKFLLDGSLNPAEYNPEQRQEVSDFAERRRIALPLGVPEFEPASPDFLRCSFVQDGEAETGYGLFPTKRFFMLTDRPNWQSTVVDTIPFLSISEVTIAGPESAERFVTKPRAIAFGLFSLAARKERTSSYLYIERHRLPVLLFRVEGLLPIELQQTLAPFTAWYREHQERLVELYRLWHPATG
jgi:hypothetical protein